MDAPRLNPQQVSQRSPQQVEVRFDPKTWEVEVGRLRPGSPARVAAERERRRLERVGLPRSEFRPCRSHGPDGTHLPGQVKVYVPITNGPASQRPYGFVFTPSRDAGGKYLSLTSYGERHPAAGSRSVYERAHHRLHGRYPDQGRAVGIEAAGRSAPGHRPPGRAPSRAPSRPPARDGLAR